MQSTPIARQVLWRRPPGETSLCKDQGPWAWAVTWVGINPWVKGEEGEQALPRPQSFSSCLSPYTAAVSQSPTPPPGRSRLSSGSQAGHSGQRAHTDLRVASHVVHVES